MPELSTIYDYMRAHASLLGERILQEYPGLHQFDDPVSPRIGGLLRKPFPAQTIAIMGLVKRWHEARTGMVVAECGTRQNADFSGRNPCSQRRKAIHFFGHGPSPPGREVGAGGLPHSARSPRLHDR
jgi:hypothetical protein